MFPVNTRLNLIGHSVPFTFKIRSFHSRAGTPFCKKIENRSTPFIDPCLLAVKHRPSTVACLRYALRTLRFYGQLKQLVMIFTGGCYCPERFRTPLIRKSFSRATRGNPCLRIRSKRHGLSTVPRLHITRVLCLRTLGRPKRSAYPGSTHPRPFPRR